MRLSSMHAPAYATHNTRRISHALGEDEERGGVSAVAMHAPLDASPAAALGDLPLGLAAGGERLARAPDGGAACRAGR